MKAIFALVSVILATSAAFATTGEFVMCEGEGVFIYAANSAAAYAVRGDILVGVVPNEYTIYGEVQYKDQSLNDARVQVLENPVVQKLALKDICLTEPEYVGFDGRANAISIIKVKVSASNLQVAVDATLRCEDYKRHKVNCK